MPLTFVAFVLCAALFLAMLACYEVGRRIGLANIARSKEGEARGRGPVEGAIFGLSGLLLAFTFSGAASRFMDRRHLIVEETNAIGTAYLRVDLLPGDAQPEMRRFFREYVQMRIDMFRKPNDVAAARAKLAEAVEMQGRIWSLAVSACGRAGTPTPATLLLLPALNAMIDITTTRAIATENHPPTVIYALLAGFCLVSALVVGRGMAATTMRHWFYAVLFAAAMAITLYVIVDMEFPRLGLIRIDSADRALVDLLNGMK